MKSFKLTSILIFATLQTINGQNNIYCVDPHTGLHYPINSTWPSTTFCGTYSCNAKLIPREGNHDTYDSVPTLAENRTREAAKEEEDSFKDATEIQTDSKKYIEDANNIHIDESDEKLNNYLKRADMLRLIGLYKAVQILIKTIEKTEHDLGVSHDQSASLGDTATTEISDNNLNNHNHIQQYYSTPESINQESITKSEEDLDTIDQKELSRLAETAATDKSNDSDDTTNISHIRGGVYLTPESIHETIEKIESDLDAIAERIEETTTSNYYYTESFNTNHIIGEQQHSLTPETSNYQTIEQIKADLGVLVQDQLTRLGDAPSIDSSDANLINLNHIRGGHQYYLTPESVNQTLEEIYSEYNEFLNKYSTFFPQNPEDNQCHLADFEGSNKQDCENPFETLTSDADISASENHHDYNNFEQTFSYESKNAPQIYSTNFQNYPGYFYPGQNLPKAQGVEESSCGKSNLNHDILSVSSGESPQVCHKKGNTLKKSTFYDQLTQISKHSPNCKNDQKIHEIIKKNSPDVNKSDYKTIIETTQNPSQDSSVNLSVSYYNYDPSQGKYVMKVPKDMEEYKQFLREYMRVYNLTKSSRLNNINDTPAHSEKMTTSTEPYDKLGVDNDNSETKKKVATLNKKEQLNDDCVNVLGISEREQVYNLPTFEYKYSNPYEHDFADYQEKLKEYTMPEDAVQMKPKHFNLPTISKSEEKKSDIFLKLGLEDDGVSRDDDLDSSRSRLLVPRLGQRGLGRVPRIPRLSNPVASSILRNKRSAKAEDVFRIGGETSDNKWKAFITVEGCPETLEPGKFKNGETEKHYPACCPQKIDD